MAKHIPNPNHLISVNNLSVKFGSKQVLKNLYLHLDQGESLAVIGASGSGKSVLFKSILGLLEVAYQGRISLFGIEPSHASRSKLTEAFKKIGMLFQYAALFDSLPLWQNVAFQSYQTKQLNKSQARQQAIELMQRVGVAAENADLFPAEISGGMKKRVGLARALFMKPTLLFVDEPTSGLDPLMCRVIDDLVLENILAYNATAITITHDLDTVKRTASRVALLHHGTIAWQGTPDDMFQSPDPVVRAFVDARKIT
ncbi:MAG: ABC transporter ATP-binding protein [Alphaproteobacteria bacterium]